MVDRLPCEYIDPALAVQTNDVVSDSMGRFSWESTTPGTWRLSSAKHSSFYGVTVWKNAGHWSIFNGKGRKLTGQPSAFTGSFGFQGHAEDGLIVRLGAGVNVVPTLVITWIELNG
jgi:hypothetical protein